jgi:hypothetical protein
MTNVLSRRAVGAGQSPVPHRQHKPFSFSSASLQEPYVTVAIAATVDEGSPAPSEILDIVHVPQARSHSRKPSTSPNLTRSQSSSKDSTKSGGTGKTSAFSSPNKRKEIGLAFSAQTSQNDGSPRKRVALEGSPKKLRRASEIARDLGADTELIFAVAKQLGVTLV